MADQLRVLVVDDEEGVRFFVREALRRSGHLPVEAASGEEALECLRETPFDLVMLDLKLGGAVDGLRVLEALRWRWPRTMVIMLTAHGSLDSAVAAIREGVDLYLLKPVDAAELREAIDQVLERRKQLGIAPTAGTQARVLRQGPFRVDLQTHEVTRGGECLELTPREFKLLVVLIENAHRVVSPPELVQAVMDYEPDYLQEARQIIRWYVHTLRQKVEPDPTRPRYIINVRGVGYRFQS
jgi:DNA-binding response OmpR family regulator